MTRRKSAELAGQADTHSTDRKGFTLKHLIAIAAVAILGFVPLGSVAAQPVMPASAPYPGHYPDANWDLSPDWALAIVRSKGLEPLSHPQRQGSAYALRALDADREVQVTVDARSGRIVRVNPTAGAAGPAPLNSISYPEGAAEQAPNPRAARAPRPNVAPATKLIADAADSKSGGAEAARPRPKAVAQTSVPSLLPKNVEVLGDRVRCDVRYQELKLPESEYRAFFSRCMGTPAKTGKAKEEPVTPPALQTAMKELSNVTAHALKMQQVTSDAL